MPELPEVETTRRGIEPFVAGARVERVVVRDARLRWPVPAALARELPGQRIRGAGRRGKYLLLEAESGTVLIHLGMSGSLSVVPARTEPVPHDHVDLVLASGRALRLNDPRRFGCVLWLTGDPGEHPLLAELGPEPLGPDFSGAALYGASRGRSAAIKHVIMDGRVVVGVGNIYASESLFRAGIRPGLAAGRLSRARCDALAAAIQGVLGDAIRAGGTTLRDFRQSDGRPGYFARQLAVYDRAGEPCERCGAAVRAGRHGQRATYWCAGCQR